MKIVVIGVGGAGCKAVNSMLRLSGVSYTGIDTDAHYTRTPEGSSLATMIIGGGLIRNLGTEGNPERGRMAALRTGEQLEGLVHGTDMVFIVAGMGGGTGTGAAPVLAELAKEAGALTIGLVTKPFNFEGALRCEVADEGISHLREKVDSLIVVDNNRLPELTDESLSVDGTFKMSGDLLRQGVQAIAEPLVNSNEINLDFAGMRTLMTSAGAAQMAIGSGKGQGRVMEAVRTALKSPLFDIPIEKVRRMLFNFTSGPDFTINEAYDAYDAVRAVVSAIDPNTYIFFGRVIDPKMEGEVRVTLIATGVPVPVSTR